MTLAGLGSFRGAGSIVLAGHGTGAENAEHGQGKGKTFTISGDVGGLYPGVTRPLILTVANPKPFEIEVTQLSVAVSGTTEQGCGAEQLEVVQPLAGFRIPGRETRTRTASVTMARTAPDACQGAVFHLSYGGKAAKT